MLAKLRACRVWYFQLTFNLILDLHMSLVLSLAIIPSLLDTHWIV